MLAIRRHNEAIAEGCAAPALARVASSPSAGANSTAGPSAGSTATGPRGPANSSNAPPAARIDHMTFSHDGQTIKEFRAICPVSRFMVARVFSRATAFNAKRFLDAVLKDMPATVQSIQVDGGSEFMRHSWRSGLRGRPREARRRTPRPPAPPPPVERPRRARQPPRPRRVLEPPRLRTHRPSSLRQAAPIRILLQPPKTALRTRLPHPERASCRSGGCLAPVPELLDQYTHLHPSITGGKVASPPWMRQAYEHIEVLAE